jgi:hypothetical protein
MRPRNIASSGLTSNSPATYQMTSGAESSGAATRKRIIDGPPEVLLERKQRRMMKNRESAARSRARRQVLCSSYSTLCYSSIVILINHITWRVHLCKV